MSAEGCDATRKQASLLGAHTLLDCTQARKRWVTEEESKPAAAGRCGAVQTGAGRAASFARGRAVLPTRWQEAGVAAGCLLRSDVGSTQHAASAATALLRAARRTAALRPAGPRLPAAACRTRVHRPVGPSQLPVGFLVCFSGTHLLHAGRDLALAALVLHARLLGGALPLQAVLLGLHHKGGHRHAALRRGCR